MCANSLHVSSGYEVCHLDFLFFFFFTPDLAVCSLPVSSSPLQTSINDRSFRKSSTTISPPIPFKFGSEMSNYTSHCVSDDDIYDTSASVWSR